MDWGKEEQERRRENRERKGKREVLLEVEITWKPFFFNPGLSVFISCLWKGSGLSYRTWSSYTPLFAPWHPDVKTGLVAGTSIPRNKSGFRLFSPFEQLMYLAGNLFNLQLAFHFYMVLVLWHYSEKGPAAHGSPDASSLNRAISQPSGTHSITWTYVLHPVLQSHHLFIQKKQRRRTIPADNFCNRKNSCQSA